MRALAYAVALLLPDSVAFAQTDSTRNLPTFTATAGKGGKMRSTAFAFIFATSLLATSSQAQTGGASHQPTVTLQGQSSGKTGFGLTAGMSRKEATKLIKGHHQGLPDGAGGYMLGAERLPLKCPVVPDAQEVGDWSEGYTLSFSDTDKLIRVKWAVGTSSFFTPSRETELRNIFDRCSAWISSSFGANTYYDNFALAGWSPSDSQSLPFSIFYGHYLLASYWIRPTPSIEAIRLESVQCKNTNSNLCITLTFEFTGWRDYAKKNAAALAEVDATSGIDAAAVLESKYPRDQRKTDDEKRLEMRTH